MLRLGGERVGVANRPGIVLVSVVEGYFDLHTCTTLIKKKPRREQTQIAVISALHLLQSVLLVF